MGGNRIVFGPRVVRTKDSSSQEWWGLQLTHAYLKKSSRLSFEDLYWNIPQLIYSFAICSPLIHPNSCPYVGILVYVRQTSSLHVRAYLNYWRQQMTEGFDVLRWSRSESVNTKTIHEWDKDLTESRNLSFVHGRLIRNNWLEIQIWECLILLPEVMRAFFKAKAFANRAYQKV